MGRHWLVLGGTGPVCGGTDWYLVELGHYVAVLAGTWWYWVSRGGTGWYLSELGQYGAVLVGTCKILLDPRVQHSV